MAVNEYGFESLASPGGARPLLRCDGCCWPPLLDADLAVRPPTLPAMFHSVGAVLLVMLAERMDAVDCRRACAGLHSSG